MYMQSNVNTQKTHIIPHCLIALLKPSQIVNCIILMYNSVYKVSQFDW